MDDVSLAVAIAAFAPVIVRAALTAWKFWLSRQEKVSITVSVDDRRIEISSASRLSVENLHSMLRALDTVRGDTSAKASGAREAADE
ncbi:hypothetical protein [Verrucosispora sp. NA02020]|uniref:hypothetical protein n=1 Tax=Verrucosispora sp. NA02020 TaxID=2742132 RepID=UPI0015903344|nr:hypothetical protein [Verrucosispora sp. NA02020]QKW12224.1 hypothetical protein HUT12_05045 [Verrucosispora sp. NA02020]